MKLIRSIWVLLGLFFGLEVYRSFLLQKAMSKGDTVRRYQEGKVTYLIFGDGNAVANYTSDSMEYEFLHSPTKTKEDDSLHAKPSGDHISEFAQVR